MSEVFEKCSNHQRFDCTYFNIYSIFLYIIFKFNGPYYYYYSRFAKDYNFE